MRRRTMLPILLLLPLVLASLLPGCGKPLQTDKPSPPGQTQPPGPVSPLAPPSSPARPTALPAPPLPPGVPSGPLEAVAKILPNGVSARWPLSDGTELLEGPVAGDNWYARYSPQKGLAEFVAGDASGATVKAIYPDRVEFICTRYAPADCIFPPFVATYSIPEHRFIESTAAVLPVTQDLRLGAEGEGGLLISVTKIECTADGLTIEWQSEVDATPAITVAGDADERILTVTIPRVAVADGIVAGDLRIAGGVVESCTTDVGIDPGAGAGQARGLKLTLRLAADKWSTLTYQCALPGGLSLWLNLYTDKPPTDLSIKVVR